MNRKRTRRRRWSLAFTLTEIMAVSAIVTSIPAGAYVRAKQKAAEIKCVHNLQQIGKTIVMYQMSTGHYPKAVFYPDEPFTQPTSIVRVLEDAGVGVPREMWICPAAPDTLRKRGLTFVYNDSFSGRQSLPNPSAAWLLIEVNCVTRKVPPPHPGGYNIVFADGHVITTRHLPRSITSKQRAALERLRGELEGRPQRCALDPAATSPAPAAVRARRGTTRPGPARPASLRACRAQRIGHRSLRERTLPL